MTNIIGIYTLNEDLRFLENLIKRFYTVFPARFTKIKLGPNQKSHQQALDKIRSSDGKDIIIIFCHGRKHSLFGCTFHAGRVGDPQFYRHGEFIGKKNISILKNQKVFCLACNSKSLGELAVKAGCKVFMGFGPVNFSPKNSYQANLIRITKTELSKSLYWALVYGIKKNLSFGQLINILHVCLNKHTDKLIKQSKKENRKFKEIYLEAASNLQDIKYGIEVHGNDNFKIAED